MIYYRKAFDNAKRCLVDARSRNNSFSKNIVKLKNPITGEQEEVMAIEYAIAWSVKYYLPTWSASTWRLVRGGYGLLLDKMLSSKRIDEEKHTQLKKTMKDLKGLNKSERVKKTSSRRKKVVTQEDIGLIEAYIEKNNSKWGESLVIWLKSSVLTGLRPNEWQTASLIEEGNRVILKSDNFKYNKDRSYAPFREIDLTNIGEGFIKLVRQQLAIVNGMKAERMTESHYIGCAGLLLNLNRKIWPRRKGNITLYTGRHQFSSNAKADDDCSDLERAAMMGHKTTKTSREGYGRKRRGSKGFTPDIADKSVLRNISNPEMKIPAFSRVKKPTV
jgi:integrase